jgi:hypothetical protein
MVGTLLSAIGALVAAKAAMKSTEVWKESQRFDLRSKAVQAWVGEAAAFRGRLKFVYKGKLNWPNDKVEIEYISEHFWSLVSLWPSVKANLDGDLLNQAESLWADVYNVYSELMSNNGNLEQLSKAVEAIYNSDLLNEVLGIKLVHSIKEGGLSKRKSKIDLYLEHLLHVDEKDLRLKFIFDHVRNYGIAASVMAAGFFLIKHGPSVSDLLGSGVVFGTMLLISGFLLLVFNIIQPVWVMVIQKVNMIPYMIISIILFLGASEFFWILVKRIVE